MLNKQSITVTIDNLTEPQRLALEDMFAMWMRLGGQGSSRWTAFFADGDGNFQPRITVNGERPKPCELTDPEKRWTCLRDELGNHIETYMLDFDPIAWALRAKRETAA